MPNFHFRLMALAFKFRDFFFLRKNILQEVGIEPGFQVLDYGCGPGSYVIPASELVGNSGKIYALDIHPLAIKSVQRIVSRKQLKNVEIIQSDCQTNLPAESINVVFLYDALHELADPESVLRECHRVLKPEGILSLSDHHLKENEIISKVSCSRLFRLLRKGKKTYSFAKEKEEKESGHNTRQD